MQLHIFFKIYSQGRSQDPRKHLKCIDNKAKSANLKTGVLRKQSTPNFPKNEHFLTPNKHDEWKIFLKTLFTGILATLLVVAFFRNLFF